MQRVAVIGNPGAGKTTFSRKLAAKTKLPVVHMDYYYHQTDQDYGNNPENWDAKVEELINQDAWIMDGNYNIHVGNRLKRADSIFYFDFPSRRSLHGVIKRRIHYRNKLREEMPNDWEEKVQFSFLVYVLRYRRKHRKRTLQALSDYPEKTVVIFTNRRQADEYLAKFP